MFFLCSPLTEHMMSTNSPSNFNSTYFSFDISACKYAPEMSAMATSLSSYISIINVDTVASSEAVGDENISPSLKELI